MICFMISEKSKLQLVHYSFIANQKCDLTVVIYQKLQVTKIIQNHLHGTSGVKKCFHCFMLAVNI